MGNFVSPRIGSATAAAFLAAAVTSLGAAAPAPPAPHGSIVVSSMRAPDLHDELWLVDVRSGRRTNVSRDPAADRDPALSPDGRTLTFVSDRGGAEALRTSRPDGGGMRRLAGPFPERANEFVQLLEPSWSPDGRRVAYLYERSGSSARRTEVRIVGRDGGASTRIATGAESVQWSPDSHRLAVSSVDAQGLWTSVHDLSGRRIWRRPGALAGWSARGELALVVPLRKWVAIVGPDGSARRTAAGVFALWSPDGRRLATGDERSLRILDDRGRRTFSSTTYAIGYGTAWSPDSRALLVFDRAFRPFRLNLGGGSPTARRLPPGGAVLRPDGTLATLTPLGISVGGRTVRLRAGGIGLCGDASLDLHWLDRDRLIYSTGGGGQHMGDLWVLAGGQARRLAGTANGWRGKPAWSPDGGRVVYEHGSALGHGAGCSAGSSPHLRLAPAGGGGVRVLTRPGNAYDGDPRWSPDGGRVAFARKSVGDLSSFGIFVVDVATGAERRLTTGQGDLPTWTADGLSVVYEQEGDVRRVRVADGSVATIGAGTLPEAAPTGQLVAFLRSGALWTVRADGTGARRLGTVSRSTRRLAPQEVDPPRWSPQADRVAVTDANGVLVFALASGTVRIPAPGAAGVAWSPDGRTISFNAPVGRYSRGIFSSQYVERTELFTAPAGGGKPTRVTSDLANVLGSAAWRP
jgi:Tol biopolymer transport system component